MPTYNWSAAPTSTVSVGVGVKADGTLATGSETAVANKTFNLAGIGTNATFAQTQTVLDAFVGGIASATYTASSAVLTTKKYAVEED